MSIALTTQPQTEGASNGALSLLSMFQEFHAELSGIRNALSLGDRMAEQGQPLPDPAQVAIRINRRLHRLLDTQAATAMRLGGRFGVELYREAQYVMAALADEMLLHGDAWAGREHWLDNLLELSLFGTRVAGERVFQRLDALLAGPPQQEYELLSVYLAALSLGFRGRYHRHQDEPIRRRYRQGLADRLAEATGYAGPAPFLCPAAYAATVTEGREVRLPHLRPWFYGLLIVLALHTAVAHGVWYVRTYRLGPLATPVTAEKPAAVPIVPAGKPEAAR
ncbi:MAG: DotU family type IV/VI secretion system protein [Niveispirillum sp.]|uniref:DotU family type IV/VI secretion system protein n=1 Tax=Niveispirillum sp. TaxID=1917217 RepID=UPI0006B9A061